MIPLNNYKINTGLSLSNEKVEKTTVVYAYQTDNPVMKEQSPGETDNGKLDIWLKRIADINWLIAATMLYLVITFLLLFRIALQLIILTIQFIKSDKVKVSDCILLYNHRFMHTFSFFRWIFVQSGSASNDDITHIIAHEKIHVNQYHSFDLLLMELLTAVMWFNPLIWMMKNSMQLVHEYLADEGAIGSGIDPLRYQTLLINQVTEEKLICLSSSFNHSLIKKRMNMMTTKKISTKSKPKLLALTLVSAMLFVITAIANGFFSEDIKAANPENTATFLILEVCPSLIRLIHWPSLIQLKIRSL